MTVFANGLEVSCKAQANQVIAAFPYVCMTPPQTPATPPGVPVPYPTFATDGDTDKGTGTVKIGDGTVTQKNLSYYSKCTGNEAGCAPMKNVITHVNTGKDYAHAWSGNVKMDGEPVSRFSDLSTNDHSSPNAGGGPGPRIAKPNVAPGANEIKCIVGEYDAKRAECSAQTPPGQFHHIIPDRTFRSGRVTRPGLTPKGNVRKSNVRMDTDKFPSQGKGICICLPPEHHCPTSSTPSGTAVVHELLDDKLTALGSGPGTRESPRGLAKLSDVRDTCLLALEGLTPDPLSDECFDLAFDTVHEKTKDISDCQVRSEKNLKNVSTTARGVMNKQ